MHEQNFVEILLVEDNPQDAELTMRALKKSGLANQLFLVEDGNKSDRIAIFNRKTGNLYVGPNNGVGTAFFQGFAVLTRAPSENRDP